MMRLEKRIYCFSFDGSVAFLFFEEIGTIQINVMPVVAGSL